MAEEEIPEYDTRKAVGPTSRRVSVQPRPDPGRYFVRLVEDLPQVRYVGLAPDDEEATIWVVIDAEPFARAFRDPIYRAYMDLLRALPEVEVGMRLVNAREYQDRLWKDLLPAQAAEQLRA